MFLQETDKKLDSYDRNYKSDQVTYELQFKMFGGKGFIPLQQFITGCGAHGRNSKKEGKLCGQLSC